jgi:hypothetical protein
MENRDYILRLIERFGQFAIAVRKLILGGKAGSAAVRDRLQQTAQHAGLDLELAHALTGRTLATIVAPDGEPEPARCWMYAETLYLDGLDARMSGHLDRAWSSFQKARMLFSMIASRGSPLPGFPEADERIRELDGQIEELEGMPRRRGGRLSRGGSSTPAA